MRDRPMFSCDQRAAFPERSCSNNELVRESVAWSPLGFVAIKVIVTRQPKMAQAMDPLPTANPEITQFFQQWLETFAGYVRAVDYASARPLFHPDVLAFGTHNDVIPGLDQWVATQ